MISKLHKFPLRTNFLSFRARANQASSPHLRLFSLPSPRSSLAVVISKKTSKLATTRNWLKRLTYDTFWPLIAKRKLACVVFYQPLPLKKSPATKNQLIIELQSLFKNL